MLGALGTFCLGRFWAWRAWRSRRHRQPQDHAEQFAPLPDPGDMPYQLAEKLLRAHLTHEQHMSRIYHQYFLVTGQSGTRYLITDDRSWNVYSLSDKGYINGMYCLTFKWPAPPPDKLLAQKTMLEASEALFKKIANNSSITTQHGTIEWSPNLSTVRQYAPAIGRAAKKK